MANIIVGGILVLVLALVIRTMIRDHKKGGCASCGGGWGCGCDHCSGCH